jgi:regulator of sirC expression with transglutaminase-like and TPR domain
LFEAELTKPDEDVSVTLAALYIAMHYSPEIDVAAYLARLEDWGTQLQDHLPPPDQRYTRRMILAINAFMFDTLGFRGAPNAEWGAVENSCLNHVLDERTGIPLTLSIVYLELARSVGFPMIGINLPAHFMVRPVAEGVEALVDVYNGGAIIAVEDAEALLSPLYGQGAKIVIDRSFFDDNTPKPRSILTRMLTNLKQIYFNSKQYDSALLMIDYQALCAPDASIAAMNQRDRGICLYLSGRYVDAIDELQGYLDAFAAAVDRQAIEGAFGRHRDTHSF